MNIGRLEIKAQRWPWQEGYNWRGATLGAMLNPIDAKTKVAGRFGGGWSFKLGIEIGGHTAILDLIFGMVRITWKGKK